MEKINYSLGIQIRLYYISIIISELQAFSPYRVRWIIEEHVNKIELMWGWQNIDRYKKLTSNYNIKAMAEG